MSSGLNAGIVTTAEAKGRRLHVGAGRHTQAHTPGTTVISINHPVTEQRGLPAPLSKALAVVLRAELLAAVSLNGNIIYKQ